MQYNFFQEVAEVLKFHRSRPVLRRYVRKCSLCTTVDIYIDEWACFLLLLVKRRPVWYIRTYNYLCSNITREENFSFSAAPRGNFGPTQTIIPYVVINPDRGPKTFKVITFLREMKIVLAFYFLSS